MDPWPSPEPGLPPPTPAGALSADGRWLWTGTSWIASSGALLPYPTNLHVQPRRSYFDRVTIWLVLALIFWLVFLGAPGPVMLEQAFTDGLTTGSWLVADRLVYVSVFSTILFGVFLGLRRRWVEAAIASVLGSGVLGMWYAGLVATYPYPHPNGTEDLMGGVALAHRSIHSAANAEPG